MSRYIELDKAIPIAIQVVVDVIGHGISQVDAVRIAEKFEDASAADVVEVVRCKDCKYYKHGGVCTNERNTIEDYCKLREENFYCSYGERTEG